MERITELQMPEGKQATFKMTEPIAEESVKTLSIYAPFGAGICNTLCTANTCLHYCIAYRKRKTVNRTKEEFYDSVVG